MKIEFTLSEQDLLNHQLFAASKSKRIMKRRTQGKIFLLLIYMAIGIFIWERNGVVTGAVFFLVCMPLYFIYAYMERKQYVKHIGAYIEDQFKTRGARKTSLFFGDDFIEMKDGENESIVPYLELEAIYETGTLYSLTLKNGQGILIPKSHSKVPEDVSKTLSQLADREGIPFCQELNWKWK
jgi:hypothetical protein